MLELLTNVVTKNDIAEAFGNEFSILREEMRKNHKSLLRWQFFFFVLNVLSTCIIFWWALK